MAIRLEVQPYCESCCDFDPDVTKPEKETLHVYDHRNIIDKDIVVRQTDTIVRCKYAKRCEAIKRYLSQQKEDSE